MGVSGKSIVKDENELREQIEKIFKRYKQPALAERYIEGREVTVGLVGNLIGPAARRLPYDENLPRIQKGLHFFPPMEVDLEPFKDTDVSIAIVSKLTWLINSIMYVQHLWIQK
jgi:D-alanine-D-alanine ligase